MDDAVKKLFAAYEDAFNKLEVERQIPFFAETFISAGPKGAIAQTRDQFALMARQAAEAYRNIGQTSAKILSLHEIPISDDYSMVKVHWGATFAKTGYKLVEFDVTYILHNPKNDPKIIMFISHQDEEKAMKDLGIEPD